MSVATRSGWRELQLFTAAAIVVTVDTVTDSFVALEPGAQPADHLPRGLVTLALLAGFRRSLRSRTFGNSHRAGARARYLAHEGFALAVAGARAVGPAGDDWTGFALGPAGIVLGASASCSCGSRVGGRAAGTCAGSSSLRPPPSASTGCSRRSGSR